MNPQLMVGPPLKLYNLRQGDFQKLTGDPPNRADIGKVSKRVLNGVLSMNQLDMEISAAASMCKKFFIILFKDCKRIFLHPVIVFLKSKNIIMSNFIYISRYRVLKKISHYIYLKESIYDIKCWLAFLCDNLLSNWVKSFQGILSLRTSFTQCCVLEASRSFMIDRLAGSWASAGFAGLWLLIIALDDVATSLIVLTAYLLSWTGWIQLIYSQQMECQPGVCPAPTACWMAMRWCFLPSTCESLWVAADEM